MTHSTTMLISDLLKLKPTTRNTENKKRQI